MAIALRRGAKTDSIPDWTQDLRLRKLESRGHDLDRAAERTAADVVSATDACDAAQAAYEKAESDYLVGTETTRAKVDKARAALEVAERELEQQRRLSGTVGRERERLAEVRVEVSALAKADAAIAFHEIYDPAIRELVDALEAAHAANCRVTELNIAARRLDIPALDAHFHQLMVSGDPGVTNSAPGGLYAIWRQGMRRAGFLK